MSQGKDREGLGSEITNDCRRALNPQFDNVSRDR